MRDDRYVSPYKYAFQTMMIAEFGDGYYPDHSQDGYVTGMTRKECLAPYDTTSRAVLFFYRPLSPSAQCDVTMA